MVKVAEDEAAPASLLRATEYVPALRSVTFVMVKDDV